MPDRGDVTRRDDSRLRQREQALARQRDPARRAALESRLTAEIGRAEQRWRDRLASVPKVSYPAGLPVVERHDDLAAALREHQVIVVAGETGSGKTTQLPKLCLELGRGVNGMIGHTQPRRIAARSVAERLAEELGVEVGEQVGYQVRFTGRASDRTLIKVMTDGILLAEMQGDRDLLAYDTLIIDEAHERSLTIDFLLGYLVTLLPRRPDLKVIVTSATIEVDRFSAHFGGAPVLEVSGRTYPVEVRYRPLLAEDAADGGEDRDQLQGILDAVRELAREGPGDILVFLSGEREIRDTADSLRGVLPEAEILPLYGRLTAAEQHRVFERGSGGRRRIVLATNVAETSLTVPGIRYVVDPGTARISRSNRRTGVLRLPIEAISQASAQQRAGRCGRVAAGICIRLYSEEDFSSRPANTDPEVLRTNLASVILRMAALRLGDITAFPFLDPPDRRSIRDGLRLLEELRALDTDGSLTRDGRRMAAVPLDPRFARMILTADELGCVADVLILVAALTIQDPRERPRDHQGEADAAHARFADDHSDFAALLSLWRYVREQQRSLSGSAFRRLCRREFLSWLRIREWQDLHGQLLGIVGELGITVPRRSDDDHQGAGTAELHTAVASGLLSQLGLRHDDGKAYSGARGTTFALAAGSPVARRAPRWIVAGELVETHRLLARTLAQVDPRWIEPVAEHLVVRSHAEPRWSRRRGAAVATESVTLLGLPLVTGRTVDLATVDPEEAHELFLRHGLVEGLVGDHHAFLRRNRRVLDVAREAEARLRRGGVAPDDWALRDFYAERVPVGITSTRAFDGWWKRERRTEPELLDLPEPAVAVADFPDAWRLGEVDLPLRYVLAPGEPDDGVTATVPVALLAHAGPLAWQVPGRRVELVAALLRTLPKETRRLLGPAPDAAANLVGVLGPEDGELLEALAHGASRLAGAPVRAADFRPEEVPAQLRMRVVVVEGDRILGDGRDLPALRRQLRGELDRAVRQAGRALARTGLREWPGIDLPRTVDVTTSGLTVTGYPALVDEGQTVGLRVLASTREQAREMTAGTNLLLRLTTPPSARPVEKALSLHEKLALAFRPHADLAALLEDCRTAAVGGLLEQHGGPAWTTPEWEALRAAVGAAVVAQTTAVTRRVATLLSLARDVSDATAGVRDARVADELRSQLGGLIRPGFVAAAGVARLPHLERYLRAMAHRMATLDRRDTERRASVARVATELTRLLHDLPSGVDPAAVEELQWDLEELRVSLFAQALGTAHPVSETRLLRAVDALRGGGTT